MKGAWLAIHPYAGIIRIRSEGIISAVNRQHPLVIRVQRYFLFPIYPKYFAEKVKRFCIIV